jgi:Glycine zipper
MKHFALLAAASALALASNIAPAAADGCSGHDHDTGTVVGGVGGAAIVGLASHSVVGAVVGGVAGALAGNAIARSEDCDHHARAGVNDRRDAYEAGRDDQADADRQRQSAEDAERDRVAQAERHDAYVAGRDDQANRDVPSDADNYPR